ncbi:LLM class flavin-dependent oxidoreductase [Actinosynnema pretiosum subsp. pretiosum]|uniref:LLM class flavin-dependent oxidoreductase n=1 Tax=Actinosynnema pretiosum subsp. pretiosum TaxID=103721 RepID=A0AA45R3L8_9PSEU|nr:LLM class flavin-dependent oxidoreductase [Actinosynnema pretiosum subsp. pretiosum]
MELSPERRRLLELVGGAAPAAPPSISLFFFAADLHDEPEAKYDLILRCAELADEVGLHAVWAPERHFDEFGAPYPSPALLLAAVAARTRRLRLRAGSVVLPLHDPLLVAEEWGVLDALSRGRAGLALASGWHADDFVLRPEAFADRKAVLVESYRALLRLWRGEGVKRETPDGRVLDVRTHPRPRRELPTWLTSTANPATWRTAAELGLNVLTALLEQTVEEVAERVAGYRRALVAHGHLTRPEVTLMLHTHLGPDDDTVRQRVRRPLLDYLSAHLDLFAKQAAASGAGVRPEDVSPADREFLLEHGLSRYYSSAGLFGTPESCLPTVDRVAEAGVTELGCLVDFGLPAEQVLECVRLLGELNTALRARAAR